MSKPEINRDHLIRIFEIIAIVCLSIFTLLLVAFLIVLVIGVHDFAKEFIYAMYNQ